MKVQCPCCSAQVPAANLNLETGWAKCERCHELFALADVVPGFAAGSPPRSAERPFNARAMVERTADELVVHVPAEGLRAATAGLLGFATFWLGFIAFWTAGALGIFGAGQPGAANWLFASFSIPFWLAGFGMMGAVAWSTWGTKSIHVAREGLSTYQRCLVWSRSRWIELERVQCARHYEAAVKKDGQQPRAVEIVYRSGSFVLPADSEEEERWLIGEINDFIRALA